MASDVQKFSQNVRTIRDVYSRKRDSTNLFPPAGRVLIDMRKDVMDEILYYTFWYEEGIGTPHCVRLADVTGALSGEILRLNRMLPEWKGDFEIVGDQIRPLQQPLPRPQIEPDDLADLDDVFEQLPVVSVDPNKHFTKRCRYESEVRNLLKCQRGSCPGTPISEHIIQLLGRSSDHELVFEKFKPRYLVLGRVHPLSTYINWILQLISGVKTLHSLGIVHRDLRIDNFVFSSDSSQIIIVDLESHWGIRQAPELSRDPDLDAGWHEKSDIYDLGDVIRHMVLGNAPIIDRVDIPVPAPLSQIVEACTHTLPEKRPSLDELHLMVSDLEQ
ncbi:kinase-like domain-containing protein [Colletotrichum godetiae]|uniref:EKC/KEOPS complex subunit BUD32 n=1 Tax=Colletotrichum godetiae TaxID=1209918 RepID=A0AAJ0A8Z0_9PEZI|nr:kinase-like domain-containing protein [Colletotrichum godetiae]KAK1658103.1 kinase-like domain-containing protein [Colletotrichum godetiae]